MADLPTSFGPTKFASTHFHERHTLAREGGTFYVDLAVENVNVSSGLVRVENHT